MIEQITLSLATPIAKVILDKFYEGLGSELAKKAIEKLPTGVKTKVQQLGQIIWEKCLRGKLGGGKLLQESANGSANAEKQLVDYLDEVLESDPSLKQEIQKIATEIHQEFNIDQQQGRNLMNVLDGQGLQVNDPLSQVIQAGDNARFYFGTKESS